MRLSVLQLATLSLLEPSHSRRKFTLLHLTVSFVFFRCFFYQGRPTKKTFTSTKRNFAALLPGADAELHHSSGEPL